MYKCHERRSRVGLSPLCTLTVDFCLYRKRKTLATSRIIKIHQSAHCVQNLDANTRYPERCVQAFLLGTLRCLPALRAIRPVALESLFADYTGTRDVFIHDTKKIQLHLLVGGGQTDIFYIILKSRQREANARIA